LKLDPAGDDPVVELGVEFPPLEDTIGRARITLVIRSIMIAGEKILKEYAPDTIYY
jgi:hypothetical protein